MFMATTESSSKRRTLLILMGFAISLIFMYLTFRQIKFGEVWNEMLKVKYGWILFGIGLHMISFLGMTLRSKLLLQPLHNYGWFTLFKSVFVSFTGNNIFPMRAGEVLRIDYLARHGKVAHSSVLAVVFVERLLDLLFLATLFFVAIPMFLSGKNVSVNSVYLPAGIAITSLVVIVCMSLFPKQVLGLAGRIASLLPEKLAHFLMEKLELFVGGLSALKSPWRVLLVLLSTGFFWLMNNLVIVTWIYAFSFHSQLPWYASIIMQTFVAFGAALPSAPGFVGTYHWFVKRSLMLLGIGATQANSYALVVHAANILPLTIFGLLLLLPDYLRSPKDFKPHGGEEELFDAHPESKPDAT